MQEKWYAIVFNQDRPKGSDPDPSQDWKAGDLYSVGSVVADRLPPWFEVVELDEAPREGQRWDPVGRRFVDAVEA